MRTTTKAMATLAIMFGGLALTTGTANAASSWGGNTWSCAGAAGPTLQKVVASINYPVGNTLDAYHVPDPC